MPTNLDLLQQEAAQTRAGTVTSQAAATAFNNFRTSIYTSGTLQDNKFDVVFKNIPFVDSRNKQLLTLRAFQADLPSAILQTVNVHRYGFGPPVQYPHNMQFNPFTAKFIVDRQGELYKLFTQWMNKIVNYNVDTQQASSLYRVDYKNKYCTDIGLIVYDNYGEKQIEFNINEAFPTFLQETSVSWVIQNQLMILSVQFNFTSWQMIQPDTTPKATPRPNTKPPSSTQIVGWTPTSDKETFGYSTDGT